MSINYQVCIKGQGYSHALYNCLLINIAITAKHTSLADLDNILATYNIHQMVIAFGPWTLHA